MLVFDGGVLRKTTDNNEIAVYNVLQEIMLFLGENPYRSELGIDYLGVFSGDIFYKDKLNTILENHTKNFKDLTIESYETSDDSEQLNVVVKFTFEDSSVIKNISIKGNT